jgi:hypothetical protein
MFIVVQINYPENAATPEVVAGYEALVANALDAAGVPYDAIETQE